MLAWCEVKIKLRKIGNQVVNDLFKIDNAISSNYLQKKRQNKQHSIKISFLGKIDFNFMSKIFNIVLGRLAIGNVE